MNEIATNEYVAFIDDLKASITEFNYNTQEYMIRHVHEIGRYIVDGGYPLKQISEDSGIKLRSIQRYAQLYREYPDLEHFLSTQDKSLSLHKIFNKILPEPKKDKTSHPDVEQLKEEFGELIKKIFDELRIISNGSVELDSEVLWEWIINNFEVKKK